MQKGVILIFTDASEAEVRKIRVSGCPVTRMNVRWASSWKGWEKTVFLPWSLTEAKKYPELYSEVGLLIYVRANTKQEIEEKICGLVS